MRIEFDFLPPSVNKCYYTDFRSKTRHKSASYREFMKKVRPYLISKDKVAGEVAVEYNFYFPDRRKRDAFNYEKALTDTLVHYGLIEDDSKIITGTVEKYFDKGKPYTVIQILPYK